MAFTISSDIFNHAGNGSTQNSPTATTGLINPDVTVYGSDSGLVLTGAGAWTITVNGGVFGAGFYGIDLSQTDTALLSSVTIGTTGDVYGLTHGILADHATSVTNSAIIASDGGSTILQNLAGSTKSLTISNAATGIIGSDGGYGVEFKGSSGDPLAVRTITNSGIITGSLGAINTDPDGLTNAVDSVTNSGTLGADEDAFGTGHVFLGLGNDSFTNSGFVYGNVDLGAGNNTLTNTKHIAGQVVALNNNDTLTNTGGTIGGNVVMGNGTNSLTNSGTIANGGVAVLGGTGNDTVKNSGTIAGSINLNHGTNLIENTKTIGVGGTAIVGGSGADTVTNSGTIKGNVTLGFGADSFTGTGGTVEGKVVLGAGNDVYDSGATVTGYVDLGNGVNSFTNKGKIEGNLSGVSIFNILSSATGEKYTFTNTGTIRDDVVLVADAGTTSNFTNSGTIGVDDVVRANIMLGNAIDIVNNSGTVYGTFYLGGGADQFTGGASNDEVQGGDGADIINLGGDKFDPVNEPGEAGDAYFAGGAKGLTTDGTDQIDGGLGAGDAYIAGRIDATTGNIVAGTDSVFINLDTASKTDSGFIWSGGKTVAAETAFGLDVSNSANGTVKDTIKNFEWAAGGNGNDVIFGSAAANTLFGDNPEGGAGGSDILYGAAGNDTIYGGIGDDFIVGGAGKDVLFGGSDGASDTDTDFFTYGAASDSTAAAAGRDRIMDFDLSADVLDLSKVASNLKFIGNNVAFTGAAGQIRTVFTSTSTIVQVDTNGDKAADFAVEIMGRQNLSAGNFILGGSIGDAGDNTFNGTTGNNSYFGAGGVDTINGGDGNDTLLGGAGVDTIHGDADNDTVSGGSGGDFIFGDAGDDTLIGGEGDDLIEGGSTGETAGDSASYAQTLAQGKYVITDNENGTITVNGSLAGEGVDTLTGIERLNFGSDAYALQLGGAGNELFEDTAGRDIILGGAGNDTIDATKGGNDVLSGGSNGAKGDTLDYSSDTAGVSVSFGTGKATGTGIGSDVIDSFENVTGGSGVDTLSGNGFDNVFVGGGGADTINAGSGADTITGGAGADNINLGASDADADSVVFAAASDFGDTVTNFGTATDRVSFGGALNTAYDDGTADDVFQFVLGDGFDGGFATTFVDFASAEAVLLAGTNGEGVNHNQLTSAIAIANELNNEFTFTGTGDVLVVVNSLDSDSFALWQYTEANADTGVATTELTLIGLFSGDGDVTTANFELIV